MLVKKSLFSLAALLFIVSAAHAENATEEWRVLGPAFSYHFSTEGAQSTPTAPSWNCNAETVVVSEAPSINYPGPIDSNLTRTLNGSFTVVSPIGDVAAHLDQPVSGEGDYLSLNNGGGYAYRLTGSGSIDPQTKNYQYKELTCITSGRAGSEKKWHQSNPALGLEKSWRYSDHIDKAFATVVRDSYGTPGTIMAGVTRLWPVATAGSVTFDAGVVAGLWYRSELDDHDKLQWALKPYVMPALSITESRSGLGMNIALAPKTSIGSRNLVATTTLMFQTTYLIRKGAEGQTSLSVETDSSGAKVNLSRTF